MKKVLEWVKQNALIVVFGAIIVGTLPTAAVLSAGWSKSLRQRQQTRAEDMLRQVNGLRVSYSLPPLAPGQPGVTLTAAPNPVLTEWFKTNRERIESQSAEVIRAAVEFNRRDHRPLVEDLFPAPRQREMVPVRTLEFADRIVGRPDRGIQGAYARLFEWAGAGPPPEPQAVVEQIRALQTRETERILGVNPQRQLTAEEQEEITRRLVQARLATYQQAARRLRFYGTPDAVDGRPTRLPTQPPSVAECFEWQWNYWLVSDIVSAIRSMNEGDVANNPVKRLESIVIVTPVLRKAEVSFAFEAPGPRDPGPDPSASLIEPEYLLSPTGRGAPNQLYDTRLARVRMVVSSSRLPELFDALARTNFMTVTDLRLSEVDVWADLEQGYFYGPEHVLRAEFEVESLWLRDWVAPLMPREVREALGVPPEPQ